MALLSPRQLPLKIVLLVAIFSLVFLNAGGWYLYNLALSALDVRTTAQLWSIGRTAALDVEASGLPELLDLVGERWPEAATSATDGDSLRTAEAAFLDTLGDVGAYLAEVARRNGLERLVLLDPGGRVLVDTGSRSAFGETEYYLPLDLPEIDAAREGEEVATVAYPVGGEYYKRAYVPVGRLGEGGSPAGMILGIEAGAGQFREMKALGGHLRAVAGLSAALGAVLMVLVYRTIRRNFALEGSAERARRALEMGQMTAAVAHEIRNPLGIIQTNAESIRSMLTNPAAREAAEDILDETERLAAVVRRFTDLSPSTSAGAPGEGTGEPIDLLGYCRGLVGRYAGLCRRAKVTVELEAPEAGAAAFRAMAYRDLLDPVFHNLLDNAVESLGGGGRVTVRLGREKDRIRVEIEDTGGGMTGEELESALRPFHTTKDGGTGIGLTLARSHVERMGGRLTLKSRKGRGTRVIVELPAAG